jgi:hypothetical protein
MLKRTAAAILACWIFTSICFAGNVYSKKNIRQVIKEVEINEQADQSAKVIPAKEVQIITKEKEPVPRVKACDGFAFGIHYDYPTLAYKAGDYDFEIGYRDIRGDRMGLLRSGYTLWKLDEQWTYVRNGIAFFPGNEPAFGLYGEIEQYLTNCISISGAIYPIRLSTQGSSIVSDATFGARCYW